MQHVFATGCVTAVGLDSSQTAAAIRARHSGIEAVVPQAGEPLLAARVPRRGASHAADRAWLGRLALRALRECLPVYRGEPGRLALFLTLPEPARGLPAGADGSGQGLASHLVRLLGVRLSPHSALLFDGPAAAAVALDRAERLLRDGLIDAALVGGVDSRLGDAERERLHDTGRLHEPSNPFGLIPGEAAAFLLTGLAGDRFSQPALACLAGVGHASEPDPLLGDRYSVAVGLQAAVRAALARAGVDEGAIDWRITDINGERYRAWESTALLARQYRAWRDGLPCLHVPACTGDVGSASLALQLVVAVRAMHGGQAPGPLAVCESSSEGPLRAACLVAPASGARRPPFREVAASAAGRPAVIRRQVERLPNELAWQVDRRRVALSRGAEPLAALAAFDDRIDAQVAFLRTTGAAGMEAVTDAIEETGPGGSFAPTLLALEAGDVRRLGALIERAREADRAGAGVACAFGWVSAGLLRSVVAGLAASAVAHERLLAATAMHHHRVAPGRWLDGLLDDVDPAVRDRALRLAGEVGATGALARMRDACRGGLPRTRYLAARSAVLLGDRHRALEALHDLAQGDSPYAEPALHLLLRSAEPTFAHEVLNRLAAGPSTPATTRRLVRACAALGDPRHLPWMLGLMTAAPFARVAGEAFALVTGARFVARAPVRAEASSDAVSGDGGDGSPDDAPEDDADAALDWPDPARVRAWWQAHASNFDAGRRYLLGAVATRPGCIEALRHGLQRHREVAAEHLCLMAPGSPLFNTAAPAWRQSRLLAAMRP